MSIECKQCGRCCYTVDGKKCPYLLVYHSNHPLKWHSTRCIIYKYRIGVVTGDRTVCVPRFRSIYNYPHCPYNEEGRIMRPDRESKND